MISIWHALEYPDLRSEFFVFTRGALQNSIYICLSKEMMVRKNMKMLISFKGKHILPAKMFFSLKKICLKKKS